MRITMTYVDTGRYGEMTLADASPVERPAVDRPRQPLLLKRILVCGKGGSGKKEMQTENAWFVLNKAESQATAAQMMDLLGELSARVIGSMPYIPQLAQAALSDRPLDEHLASRHVEPIVARLEAIAAGEGGVLEGEGSTPT